MEALRKQQSLQGPQTDDELHAWIKTNLGMNIPRNAVCDGHCAPFDFIADMYFERETAALAMASRGGSKTMSSAIIHLLNSLFKPGCESLTVGAIEAQSKRAYENLKKLLVIHGKVNLPAEHPKVIRTIESETTFEGGSKVEIVPGTMAAVNGPHNQKVHVDEVELMDPSVWNESRNISQSKVYFEINPITGEEEEKIIRAQDWVTSTRKRAAGPMQKLLDTITEAEKGGYKPPFKLYVWCFAEAAKRVDNCQVAYPDLPDDQKCNCDQIVNGKWEDGSPRRFSDVCKGKLARSDGFHELDNIHKRFQEQDQDTWEAQQECAKPEMGGAVFKTWSRQRYAIKWWSPDPSLGPIYQGVDYGGGTSPFAANWYQVLNQDVYWWGLDQTRSDAPSKLLKAGTRVCFAELYKSEMGNTVLGHEVKRMEEEWRRVYPDFKVEKRFVDPANLAARHDWFAIGLRTQFFCTRSIPEQIRTCNAVLKDDLFVYDAVNVKMFPLEAEAYHYPEKKSGLEYDPEIPVDDFNHTMSNFRYTMENLKYLERRGSIIGNVPKSGDKIHRTAPKNPTKSGVSRYMPRERTI